MKCHRSLVPSSPCILEEALGDLVREPAVPVPPLEPPGRGPKKGRTPTRRQIQRHEERLGQLVRAISKAAGSPLLLIPGAEHASVSEPPACSQPVLICSDRKEVGDGGGTNSKMICVGVLHGGRHSPQLSTPSSLPDSGETGGRASVLGAEGSQSRGTFDPSDPWSR